MKFKFIVLLALPIFFSCKKKELEHTCPPTTTEDPYIAPCNQPIDTAYTQVEVFGSPDSTNPDANFRVQFSVPNSFGEVWEASFVSEPVSGKYKLSDTLFNDSYASMHVLYNLYHRTTIDRGEYLYVKNTPNELIVSFCDILLETRPGGDQIWGIDKTLVFNK